MAIRSISRLKRMEGHDLGDLVELWIKKDCDTRACLLAEEEEKMPMFTGYIIAMDFQKLTLSNKSPFFPNTEMPEIKQRLTTIPYENIYRIQNRYHRNPTPEYF
ncbi:MAG: hypothetical protein V1743_02345 [Nanoarchaeota archaeon]